MELFTPEFITTMIQLSLAMGLGLILGMERIIAHKTAGMRTYAMVSMTSAFFIIISEQVTQSFSGAVDFDPLRIAAQIVVGVGFLGAGLIIFKDDKIQNLTTASGLWTCSAIGMGVGFGLYKESVFVTVLALFVLGVLSFVERFIRLRYFPDQKFVDSEKKREQ